MKQSLSRLTSLYEVRCMRSVRIEPISYLDDGRVVEFTRSLYRGDAYNFVAKLRLKKE